MTMARWFTQTATISRLVAGLNNTESYQTLSTVPCLIQETTGNKTTMEAEAVFRSHRMYCALSTDIKDDDHVTEGGRSFTVKGIIKREQGSPNVQHLEVLLEKKEG